MKESLKQKNLEIYTDTASAYLYFDASKIKPGNTIYKTEPPIGTRQNRELLLNALDLKLIDLISSYHFAVPLDYKAIKEKNFRKAFGGITSLGNTLQAAWTAVYKRQLRE